MPIIRILVSTPAKADWPATCLFAIYMKSKGFKNARDIKPHMGHIPHTVAAQLFPTIVMAPFICSILTKNGMPCM